LDDRNDRRKKVEYRRRFQKQPVSDDSETGWRF
jgi:hypothetical protein